MKKNIDKEIEDLQKLIELYKGENKLLALRNKKKELILKKLQIYQLLGMKKD